MAKRTCITPGCPNLSTRTRCPIHEAEHQHHRNTTRIHLQGDWRKLSKQQRERVPYCQCPGCTACTPYGCGRITDLCADHVTSRDATVLMTLCRRCNSVKG